MNVASRRIIDFLSQDPIGQYRRNPNFHIDPIVRLFRSSRQEQQIQNICLNLIYCCLYIELYFTSSDIDFSRKHGISMAFVNFLPKLFTYVLVMYGWRNVQTEGHPYYFIPGVLRIVYYTCYYMVGLAAVHFAKPCDCVGGDGSTDGCLVIDHVTNSLLEFPYNWFGVEKDSRVFQISHSGFLVFCRSIGVVYQLFLLMLVVKCWIFVSNCRRRALIARRGWCRAAAG